MTTFVSDGPTIFSQTIIFGPGQECEHFVEDHMEQIDNKKDSKFQRI